MLHYRKRKSSIIGPGGFYFGSESADATEKSNVMEVGEMEKLQLDPKTRGIEGSGPLLKLKRCFEPSKELEPFLFKGKKEIGAYATVTTYTTKQELELEVVIAEVSLALSHELTIEQKNCGRELKPETEITPMHESIAGRISSLHAWYGEQFLDCISPKMLIFLQSKKDSIPIIMQFNKETGKCFADIAKGTIPKETKIFLVRRQVVLPS
jgi:hypothetical protein